MSFEGVWPNEELKISSPLIWYLKDDGSSNGFHDVFAFKLLTST